MSMKRLQNFHLGIIRDKEELDGIMVYGASYSER